MRRVIHGLIAASLGLFAWAAQAEIPVTPEVPPPPEKCSSARLKSAYGSGYKGGWSIIHSAWKRIANCDQVEYFVDVCDGTLSSYQLSAPSDYTGCRYLGYMDGAYTLIERVFESCSKECSSNGRAIGSMAAMEYCKLSIAFGGLEEIEDLIRPPVLLCGAEFQLTCDTTFIQESMSYVDPNNNQCLPYTDPTPGEVDLYEEVWKQTAVIQCAYILPEKSLED